VNAAVIDFEGPRIQNGCEAAFILPIIIILNCFYHISVYLNARRLAQHIYLQNKPRRVLRLHHYTNQSRQSPAYYPASLTLSHVLVWRQVRSCGKRLLNLQQLADQSLLVIYLNQVRYAICPQDLDSLVFLATEKKIPAEYRQKRPQCPASNPPDLPRHRQKITDLLDDQIVRKRLFISAFSVRHPPLTRKITNRLVLRPR
jgi:hypothetical protein